MDPQADSKDAPGRTSSAKRYVYEPILIPVGKGGYQFRLLSKKTHRVRIFLGPLADVAEKLGLTRGEEELLRGVAKNWDQWSEKERAQKAWLVEEIFRGALERNTDLRESLERLFRGLPGDDTGS
jgi:hypothetical protein